MMNDGPQKQRRKGRVSKALRGEKEKEKVKLKLQEQKRKSRRIYEVRGTRLED